MSGQLHGVLSLVVALYRIERVAGGWCSRESSSKEKEGKPHLAFSNGGGSCAGFPLIRY